MSEQLHHVLATLPCTAPFDLRYSLEFLRGFGPMVGEQTIANGRVTKAVMHHGQAVAFTVRQVRAGAEPQLAVRLDSHDAISDETCDAVLARVASFLSVDEDMSAFYAMARRDNAFAPLAERFRGLHHVKFVTPFEAASWGVINQRNSANSRAADET